MKKLLILLPLLLSAQFSRAGYIGAHGSQVLTSDEIRCALEKIAAATEASAAHAFVAETAEGAIKVSEPDQFGSVVETSVVTMQVTVEQQGDGGDVFDIGILTAKTNYSLDLIGSSFGIQFEDMKVFDKSVNFSECGSQN